MEWIEEFDDEDLREITRQYLPNTVVWTTDWTTGSLSEQLERGVFNVDPPFQRRSAWTDKKASLYVESLLIGCPVPPITLAELPTNTGSSYQYVVIDGKQRLSSLKRFAVDQSLQLSGLEALPALNGKNFAEVVLQPEFVRFSNLPIRTVVLRNWVKDEVLQFVFNRLNTQVTPLSTHELRRSLLAGPFTDYLDVRSAQSQGIQRILGIDEPDYRLRDAELLLRAIAFYQFLPRYRGNLKVFLDTVTKTLNKAWRSGDTGARVDSIANEIDDAIIATFDVFGDEAFQRFDAEMGHYTGRFNRAIFDIMIAAFRYGDVRDRATSDENAVVAAYEQLNAEPRFAAMVASTTKRPDAVYGRVRTWLETLGRVLDIPNLPNRPNLAFD
jgi:Protein of unknown function DUF262